MKIRMTKQPGGVLTPADDFEAERLTKFKTGEEYQIDIKLSRNPAFLRKVMQFFRFCFEHWDGRKTHPHLDDQQLFEHFRKELTKTAGFYYEAYDLQGRLHIEAKSLSYEKMEEEEFRRCYIALTNAAWKSLFSSCDESTYNQLLSFF